MNHAANPIGVSLMEGARFPPVPGRHQGDIGLDICADIGRLLHLAPGESAFVDGGFRLQFGHGWAGLILPRSSSNRQGLHVCTGVIDNGYTGNIGAELRNISQKCIQIEPGDRIAQLVLIPAFRPTPIEVATFVPTDRGDSGFGSTGS